MHEPPIPACFRGASAAVPPPSTAAGPRLTTSSYHTHLGLAALSWSPTVLGLNLRIDLRLSPAAAGGPDPGGAESPPADAEAEPIRLRVRPWLFWKRRGSKRFHVTSSDQRQRIIEVAWDLSHARFPAGGGPEPAAGFFVAVAVDREMLVAAGDMSDEAYRKTKAARPAPQAGPLLLSKKEHVTLAVNNNSERTYTTSITFEGRKRQISVKIGSAKEPSTSMSISVNEIQLLHVKRLRWKFRGSERVEIDCGERVQISWDLHNWLFKPSEETPPTGEQSEVAVFVFRFERNLAAEVHSHKQQLCRAPAGYCNWSGSSSGGERGKRRKSLVKTGSSSSSSSVSSASSSTVMEWASVEEAELRSADGFSLVIYAWKS